jgi:two-component system sensor histidine kinase YesM
MVGLQHVGPLEDPVQPESWAFLIFQQINDLYRVQDRVGMLGISISENVLAEQYHSNDSANAMTYMLIDNDGTILSHRDKTKIGTQADIDSLPDEQRGTFEQKDELLVYEYVRDWDFYLIGLMPMDVLLADNRILILEVLIAMAGVTVLTIILALLFSRQLTRPFGELINSMNLIAQGDLDQTLDLSRYGDEYATVSTGFNTMTSRIRQLLRQIVEEQRQLQEIELKALHAQIKPHFLYNTLDSIHWLAAVNEQQEISTIVKALAGFYRICLSQGRDMISLRTELEHVQHYLVIQRIRYNDLFEYEQAVPEKLLNIMLPKMTLQPLVENAIYHGLRGKRVSGKIAITARALDGIVSIDVADDGSGMTRDKLKEMNQMSGDSESSSYGLKNVNQRLKLTFGDEYGLVFRNNSMGGLTCTVRIPEEGGTTIDVFDTDS